MRSQSTQHANDAPPPTVSAWFDGPQMCAGPNRRVTSPHASCTATAITSGCPCISTTPPPLYPHVSCAVCPCPVPHLMSTHTHTSPHVLMAPRHARAPNDAPRPTANASHAPYSRACPQTGLPPHLAHPVPTRHTTSTPHLRTAVGERAVWAHG